MANEPVAVRGRTNSRGEVWFHVVFGTLGIFLNPGAVPFGRWTGCHRATLQPVRDAATGTRPRYRRVALIWH